MKKLLDKSGYTLAQLIIVLAISGVLISLSFGGLVFMRTAISVTNTLQTIKSAIRETQDRALTYSTYKNGVNSPGWDNRWVYGYTIEYNAATKNFIIFTIVSNDNTIPDSAAKTAEIRAKYASNIKCTDVASGAIYLTFASASANGGANVTCVAEKQIPLSATISSSTCQVLFTTVNGKITLQSNAASCRVTVVQTLKSMLLTINNVGIGNIKICDGTPASCP